MIWLREQHIPAVARAFGDRDRPHWQTPWRVDTEQALFGLGEMTRFPLPTQADGMRSTINDPRDLERYARLKVDIPAVLAARVSHRSRALRVAEDVAPSRSALRGVATP
jgi:hypothetical protein